MGLENHISRTQEPLKHFAHKVEVYDFQMSARIPTQSCSTSKFLYDLMGHDTKTIIMSPTGGVTCKSYGKLRKDVTKKDYVRMFFGNKGPDQVELTDEDAERFWLLHSPKFREELVQAGWLVFPEVTHDDKVSKDELKEFHMDSLFSEHTYKRKFLLADLVRAIEITDHNKVDYQLLLKDLQELMPFAEKIEYIYPGQQGSGHQERFFHLPVRYKDSNIILTLDQLDVITTESKREEEPNTMRRNIFLTVDFCENRYDIPDWWTPATTRRIHLLTEEYLKKQGTEYNIHECTKKEGIKIKFTNREYDQCVLEPNTSEFLDKAIETKKFVKCAIAAEYESYEKQENDVLEKRKNMIQAKVSAERE